MKEIINDPCLKITCLPIPLLSMISGNYRENS